MANGTSSEITDPDLLGQLEASDKEVTDPSLIAQLEGPAASVTHHATYNVVNGQLVPVGSAASNAAALPTFGMSAFDKFIAGAGKAPVDIGLGLGQLTGLIPQEDIDRTQARDAALMSTGAGLTGNIAGNLGTIVAGGGALGALARGAGLAGTASTIGGFVNPATITGGAVAGSIQGAAAPVPTGQSRLFNTGVGALAGGAGNAIARVPSMLTGPDGPITKAVQALTDAGVPLDAAQRTGSVLLARAKAMLGDNPLTAGAQKDFAEMQGRTFTKAVLKTIGADADAATPDVMGAAKKALGDTYDDVASRTSIPYDHLEVPLANIETEARKVLSDQQFNIVRRNLDDIVNKAAENGGSISGEQFSNIKHTLDKLSKGSDQDVGEVARDMRQALHDALQTSAQASGNTADVELLKKTNQQWGNMRKIEGAIAIDGSGQISPAKLANVLGQKANRYASVYGHGDQSLVNLAQAGKALLGAPLPQSGTIPRALAQAIPAAAVGTYEGLRTGDLKTGLEYAGGAYLLPKLIQKGMLSQGAGGEIMGGLGRFAGGTLPSSQLVGGALQHGSLSALLGLQSSKAQDKEEEKQAGK